MRRIDREKQIVGVMVAGYCRRHHSAGAGGLCPECEALTRYAFERLDRCRYGATKPSCRRCTTHCYAPLRREQIRRVMAYMGPRMLYLHPIMALRHLLK